MNNPPSRKLTAAVALIASAMLIIELVITRLFSVLFYYHYSFFAVSLVMSGISLGAILASRWKVRSMEAAKFNNRLSLLAVVFAGLTAAGLAYLAFSPGIAEFWWALAGAGSKHPTMGHVAGAALVFLPGLIAAGAFLASAFARHSAWIGRLYAADLAAAAAACLAAIGLMRVLPGPMALLPPVLLAAMAGLVVAPNSRTRLANGILAGASAVCVLLLLAGFSAPAMLSADQRPHMEKWNEHSRVLVYKNPSSYEVLIDKGAGTTILPVSKRQPGAPIPARAHWDASSAYLAYKLGRPLDEVAIIGVGGGRDLLAPLANGAAHVDGYEVNGLLLDLLRGPFAAYSGLASWPEVSLIHSEARVGISRVRKKYNVIQASLIDTWAATASGGLVLSENTIYTEESWASFLDALGSNGLLTFTRWYIPAAPAEAQRLVSLAVVALQQAGVAQPRAHILLVASGAKPNQAGKAGSIQMGTIILSKRPFSPSELTRARTVLGEMGGQILAAPDQPSRDAEINRLLEPRLWQRAVDESAYDLSPPTDARPYFFLPVRLMDVPGLMGKRIGKMFEITFNAVRVLLVLAGLALLFSLAVLLMGLFSLPSAEAETTPEKRKVYRWMNLYFMGIGLGYIMVQLGLHQVAIVVLGHPTFALSVVLFSMLLGSGLGAALSARLTERRSFRMVWLLVALMLALLVAALPPLAALGHHIPVGLRVAGAIILLGGVGCGLGFVLPLGVQLVSPTGEWAVQKVWAVNGAATILGAVLAALIGIAAGSHVVLAAGLICYLAVLGVGLKVLGLAEAE